MYKSLEHIIREIKEGKCCCEKKKDSLENAIRKVQKKEYESSYAARDSKPVDENDIKLAKDYGESIEEMNVVTNSGGEMTGRQFSTRSPIIAPRKDSDDGHGQAAKNVSVQRSKAIQKFSSKNVSDGGKISEGKIPPIPPKAAETLVKGTEDLLDMLWRAPSKSTQIVPYGKSKLPAQPKATVPAKPAEPTTKPADLITKPAEPTTKPAETKVAPAETKVAPAETKVAPAEVKTKPAETKVAPAEPKIGAPKPVEPKAAVPKLPGIKLPMPYLTAIPVQYIGPLYGSKTSIGRHRSIPVTNLAKQPRSMKEDTESRKLIQNMPRKDSGDRHDIELVGRETSNPKTTKEKTSRQAEYKTKIIDESKKLADIVKKVSKENEGKTKVYDNVIINPDLNRIDPNQQIKEGLLGKAIKYGLGQTAVTAGLSGLYGAGVASGRGEDPIKGGIEGAKAVVTEPIRKYKEGDKLGAAADVASTVHPVGALTDLARLAAQTDTGRKIGKAIGDYVPGAKAAAEAAKKFREKIGGKSTFEPAEPKQPDPSKEPEQTSSEIVPKKVKTTVEKPDSSFVSSKPQETEIVPKKVKTTIEPESGGKKIKSFKNYNKNK